MQRLIITLVSLVVLFGLIDHPAARGQKSARSVPGIGWEALRSKLVCPSAGGRSDIDRVYAVSVTFRKTGGVSSVDVRRLDGESMNAPEDYCDSAIVMHTKEIVAAERWKPVPAAARVRETEFILNVSHGEFGIGFERDGRVEYLAPLGKDSVRTTLVR